MFLFPDRRHDANLAISDLKNSFVGLSVAISDVDAMQPFDSDLIHFVGNRVIPVSGQAVDAGPDQEVRSGFPGRTEQLVYVALAVTDVDASPWIGQQRRGLLDVLQPPDALLLLDRNTRWINLLLERGGPLELLRVQNFIAASPSGKPSLVTAKLECIRMPQTVCDLRRPALSRPLLMLLVIPIASVSSR